MRPQILIAASLSLFACGQFALKASISDRMAALPSDLRGIWQTEGYGYVVDVRDDALVAYDATPTVCVKNDDTSGEILEIFEASTLSFAQHGQSFQITMPFEPHPIKANRLAVVPDPCTSLVPDTPLGNFDAFVSFFQTHYAFFDLYDVNWPQATAAARRTLSDNTTDEELFQVMSGLLQPLKDGHVQLDGRIGRRDVSFEPYKGETFDALVAKANRDGISVDKMEDRFQEGYWISDISQQILGGEGTMAGSGFVQYGMTSDDIGYMAFVTVAGYATGDIGESEADLNALHQIMDKALLEFEQKGAKAVILDLSVNFGGQDFISRKIAERFAQAPVRAYSKRAGDRKGARDFELRLTPYAGRRFEGPVYVLTSDVTVSGGEILTMSLRALPNVVHVGAPTRGALSDVLTKYLPNGWELSLSNEIYKDHKGIKWEGRGITPDIALPVFDPNDPTRGHLEAVRRIIGMIDRM